MRTRILAFAIAALALASPAVAQTLSTQDYIDIQQLYARYNVALDGGDAEGYANLFTPDGVFNTSKGRDALIAFVKGSAAKGGTTRHWNTNLVITPTPEGASGTVYLFLMDVAARPPAISLAARYQDVLVKTAQGWRFKQRTTRIDMAPAAPKPPQ
jgi:uncharacterized protein (TIGR02246 family)